MFIVGKLKIQTKILKIHQAKTLNLGARRYIVKGYQ